MRKTHGMSKTPTYSAWCHMKARCLDEGSTDFPRWGGRGITVCQRWQDSFEAFYEDMGEKPKGKSIDRLDNSRGYEPGNCAWVTPKEQARNTRRNVWIEIDGQTKLLTDWLDDLGVSRPTYHRRRRAGLSPSEALTKVSRNDSRKFIEVEGETKTLQEWLSHFGLKRSTYNYRLRAGMSDQEALTTPLDSRKSR